MEPQVVMEPQTADAPAWLIVVILVAFPVFFIAIWSGVLFLLSRLAGWHRLAQHYARGDRKPTGHYVSGSSGKVGFTNYNQMLILHFNQEGFFIEVNPLFKVGHKPLFIPWSEVSERRTVNLLFAKLEKLSIGRPKVGTISLPTKVLDSIAKEWQPTVS